MASNPSILKQPEFQCIIDYFEEGGRAAVTLVAADEEWHCCRNISELKKIANAWEFKTIGFQTHSPKLYRRLSEFVPIILLNPPEPK